MEIWAHRGASEWAPENTMASFMKAYILNSDGVELDVHRTVDGVFVVIHDASVARTTQGYGYVHNMTYAALQSLDAGYKFDPAFRGERIPRLEEVLSFIRSTNMKLNIELKSEQHSYDYLEEELLQLVYHYNLMERTVFSSFDHPRLARLRQLDPQAVIALLCTDFQLVSPHYAKQFGAQGVHPSRKSVTPEFMRAALAEGIAVRPYTVNNEVEAKQFYAWGVDAVISDRPDVIRRGIGGP